MLTAVDGEILVQELHILVVEVQASSCGDPYFQGLIHYQREHRPSLHLVDLHFKGLFLFLALAPTFGPETDIEFFEA